MQDVINIEISIQPQQQGSYFTLPFIVGEGVERLSCTYSYLRRRADQQQLEHGAFTAQPEVNIIDLGLIGPDGAQVGASGSDKLTFFVSEQQATPGYRPTPILPGEWQILVGVYKVAPEGVQVRYEVVLEYKEMRLLKGDLHTHTLASDGVHSAQELAVKARRNGLDFVVVTDHNQFVSADALPREQGVTMIPGVEWTHFRGHANFIGAEQPYDEPFFTNTEEEARARFESARRRGALICINHPFDPTCGFGFDLQGLPFDLLEVWNGPMRESNLRALGLWQQLLAGGRRIPMCGGSDYHRDTPFIFLGGPTTCVYARSNGASDILEALRAGRSFVTFAPDGPLLEMSAGENGAVMGGAVRWADVKTVKIRASRLHGGDVLRVVTGSSAQAVCTAASDGELELEFPMPAPGFARVEVLRAFLPGLPMLPAALSNPIYFEEG